MATYDNKFKTRALDGALDIFDEGAVDPSGDVQFLTVAAAELAILPMSNPAFADAVMNGAVSEADANPLTDDTSVTDGIIGLIRWRDRDNVTRCEFTVGLPGSGANIIFVNNVIPPGAEYLALESLTMAFAWLEG